jgi:hypothetical protein
MIKKFLYLILIVSVIKMPLQAGSKIAGKWFSVNRNMEGIGTILVFGNDGKMKMVTAVITEYKYVQKRDSLVFSFMPYNKNYLPVDNTVPFKLTPDTLYFFPGDTARIQKLVKVESPRKTKDKFTGLWKFRHSKGYDASWQFTNQGIAQINVNFKTENGKYSVKKGSLEIRLKDRPFENPLFSISGDTLTLTSQKRKTFEKFFKLKP